MKSALDLAMAEAEGGDGEDLADLFGDLVPPAVAAPARSGPQGGRPKGRRNRSTEAFRRYLLTKYPHPLETLMALTTRTPRDLAEELGLKRQRTIEGITIDDGPDTAEAMKIIIRAAEAALPYMAQKMPVQVDVDNKGGGPAILVFGDLEVQQAPQSHDDGSLVIDGEQYQELIDFEDGQSHGDSRTAEEKASKSND